MTGKVIGITVAGILAIIALSVALLYLTGTIKKETAGFRGEVDATEKIQADGTFRIEAYNSFYDKCAAVQSDEARINALAEELEGDVSPKRKEQIGASATAVRSSRAEKINQYNADASKDWTVGQFRNNELPYELDVNDMNTECRL